MDTYGESHERMKQECERRKIAASVRSLFLASLYRVCVRTQHAPILMNNCCSHHGSIRVTQRNELGRASPGLLTQVRKHANLGHPYGVATTSSAASVHCFVNLPRQVVGSR